MLHCPETVHGPVRFLGVWLCALGGRAGTQPGIFEATLYPAHGDVAALETLVLHADLTGATSHRPRHAFIRLREQPAH
eukprot:SAG11_NODE_4332_length_1945_cov_1.432828_1_plen_78_part_00